MRGGHNSTTKRRKDAIALGFRSGLESDVADILKSKSIKFEFEPADSVIP